jgi:hypothetical protein
MPLILPYSGLIKAKPGGTSVTATNVDPLDVFNDDATDRSAYTFDVPAGDGGLVAVCYAGNEANASNAASVSSVTIDGQTATNLSIAASGAGSALVGLSYATGVSSGTVEVVVTLSDTLQELIWCAWQIAGHTSSTPHDTLVTSDTGGVNDFVSGIINIPDGGCCIAWGIGNYVETGDNVAWTGLTETAETRGNLGLQTSTASNSSMSSESNRTITATFSSPTAGEAEAADLHLIAISWG